MVGVGRSVEESPIAAPLNARPLVTKRLQTYSTKETVRRARSGGESRLGDLIDCAFLSSPFDEA